jgi:hypothetical protein
LQIPVEISQVFTTPSLSLEIAIPVPAWRPTDRILDEVSGADSGSVITGSVDKAPTCQNLTYLSSDTETREDGEENARDQIGPVCPTRVPTR